MATVYMRRNDGRRPPQGIRSLDRFDDRKRSRGGDKNRSRGTSNRSGNRSGGGRGGKKNYQEMAVDLSKLVDKAQPQEAEETFTPVHTFNDFPVDARLKENIERK